LKNNRILRILPPFTDNKNQYMKARMPVQAKFSKEKIDNSDTDLFPIVGIGASAGGLEALEQFLGNVPENSGMAFVVIQHMDPTQKGMLPELLQRISSIKVCQVKDRMFIKPNCIYVIPPNKSMSIVKKMFNLYSPQEE
jgi:two-component system, chemotaxis family, CheB/CheR fusion protein